MSCSLVTLHLSLAQDYAPVHFCNYLANLLDEFSVALLIYFSTAPPRHLYKHQTLGCLSFLHRIHNMSTRAVLALLHIPQTVELRLDWLRAHDLKRKMSVIKFSQFRYWYFLVICYKGFIHQQKVTLICIEYEFECLSGIGE